MKNNLLFSATAALALVGSSCKPEGEATVSDTQQITADLVAQTVGAIEQDTGHRPNSDRVRLVLEKPRMGDLYRKIDEDGRTTVYFETLCAEYEKTLGKDLSGRMADVVSHLWTLSDLIQEGGLTKEDIDTIINNNLVLSGLHEDEDPKISTVLEGDSKGFFASSAKTQASISGKTLTLTREGYGVTLAVKHSGE